MRLIDADNIKIPGDANYKASVKRVIESQPTAYDVDKVIEKLENRIVQHEIVKKEKPQDIYDRIHNVSAKSFIRAYKAAIKIVKAGGADE